MSFQQYDVNCQKWFNKPATLSDMPQLQLNEISVNGFLKKFRRLKNIGLIQEGIIVQIKIILNGSDRNRIWILLRTVQAVDQDAHVQMANLVFER